MYLVLVYMDNSSLLSRHIIYLSLGHHLSKCTYWLGILAADEIPYRHPLRLLKVICYPDRNARKEPGLK